MDTNHAGMLSVAHQSLVTCRQQSALHGCSRSSRRTRPCTVCWSDHWTSKQCDGSHVQNKRSVNDSNNNNNKGPVMNINPRDNVWVTERPTVKKGRRHLVQQGAMLFKETRLNFDTNRTVMCTCRKIVLSSVKLALVNTMA